MRLYVIMCVIMCVFRLLEEGNVEAAEMQKQRIEQLQRERRRVLEENNMTHQPRFFQYEPTVLLNVHCHYFTMRAFIWGL